MEPEAACGCEGCLQPSHPCRCLLRVTNTRGCDSCVERNVRLGQDVLGGPCWQLRHACSKYVRADWVDIASCSCFLPALAVPACVQFSAATACCIHHSSADPASWLAFMHMVVGAPCSGAQVFCPCCRKKLCCERSSLLVGIFHR
jgi:hypothetical protein